MAGPVIDARMDIVGSRLSNTSGSGMVAVLIDGALQLLQKVIDIDEISFGFQIRKGKRIRMHRRMLRVSNHCTTSTAVLGHSTLVAANRKRHIC